MTVELSDPTVSVIVPFYNRRSFLPAVVKTVADQTYRNIQLVIVDDGSSDGLEEAVAALEDGLPVRFVRMPENCGAALARNAGIDAAQGELVAFLDSDDEWHPEKIAAQVAHLSRSPNWTHLVSLTRQQVRGKGNRIAPRRLMSRSDKVGPYLFLQGGIIQSSMLVLATELARTVRFGEDMHDDWTFALRLEKNGAVFEMLALPLTIYDDGSDRPRRSPTYSPQRLDWLERQRNQIGERAFFAASAVVASHLQHVPEAKPARIIAIACRKRAINPVRAAYYLLALTSPSIRLLASGFQQRVLSTIHRPTLKRRTTGAQKITANNPHRARP